MKQISILTLGLCLSCLAGERNVPVPPTSSPSASNALALSFARIEAQVAPAIVACKWGRFSGTGVIVSDEGLVLTVVTPNLLITDCGLTPGESGGALFDSQGRLIGIHSAKSVSKAPVSFHHRAALYCKNWSSLLSNNWNPAPRVELGATIADDLEGPRIESIHEKGPAFEAGLRAGDLIRKVNGTSIEDEISFFQI